MIFVIIFAGVAAILVNRYSGDSLIAQITVDGNVIETIDLNSVENTRTVITKTSPKTAILGYNLLQTLSNPIPLC